MQLFLYRDKKEDLIHASINQKHTRSLRREVMSVERESNKKREDE